MQQKHAVVKMAGCDAERSKTDMAELALQQSFAKHKLGRRIGAVHFVIYASR